MIEAVCKCGKHYRLGDESAGKKLRCKACGGVVHVAEKLDELEEVVEEAPEESEERGPDEAQPSGAQDEPRPAAAAEAPSEPPATDSSAVEASQAQLAKPALVDDSRANYEALNSSLQPRDLSADELNRCRQKMTEYSRSIPHHGLGDLGEVAKITRAQAFPVHSLGLRTLYETRTVQRRVEPHWGAQLPPKTTDESNIAVWQYDLPLASGFEAGKNAHRVARSGSVATCEACGGEGKPTCPRCRGEKEERCSKCSGKGHTVCPSCYGRGEKRQSRKVQKQKHCTCRGRDRTCYKCKGTGIIYYDEDEHEYVQCLACGGLKQVTCSECNGDRKVECNRCGGEGIVTCPTCRGQRNVVSYLELAQEFEPAADNETLVHDGVIAEARDKLDAKDYDEVFALTQDELSGDRVEKIAAGRLRNALTAKTTAAQSRRGPACRIARQQVEVGLAVAARVDYTFNGKEYTFWMAGKGLRLHAPRNPVSDYVEDAAARGAALWISGKRAEAVECIRKCWYMARADAQCMARFQAAKIPPVLRDWADDEKQARTATIIGACLLGGGCLSVICALGFLVLAVTGTVERSHGRVEALSEAERALCGCLGILALAALAVCAVLTCVFFVKRGRIKQRILAHGAAAQPAVGKKAEAAKPSASAPGAKP